MKDILFALSLLSLIDAALNKAFSAFAQCKGKIELAQLCTARETAALVAMFGFSIIAKLWA